MIEKGAHPPSTASGSTHRLKKMKLVVHRVDSIRYNTDPETPHHWVTAGGSLHPTKSNSGVTCSRKCSQSSVRICNTSSQPFAFNRTHPPPNEITYSKPFFPLCPYVDSVHGGLAPETGLSLLIGALIKDTLSALKAWVDSGVQWLNIPRGDWFSMGSISTGFSGSC